MPRVVARLEVVDPGFTRTRHGVRTTCATVLSGLTLAAVTSVFDATEALRISLFGAGACFFAALLVTDRGRSDRARTFGWAALECQLPGESHRRATTGAALDRAHSALDSMIASAVVNTHLFPRQGSPLTEQGVRIDAVHEAFLRLTPLLADSSRRLHGWTDLRVEMSIRLLRDDVDAAKAALRGDPAPANGVATSDAHQPQPLWLTDNLHTRLGELAQHR